MLRYPLREGDKVGYRKLFGALGEEFVLFATKVAKDCAQGVANHLATLVERSPHYLYK